jgi:hypothetical protein
MQSQADPIEQTTSTCCGRSHDGPGAGDHDLPYRFGRAPRASGTYPFSTRQYARLLVLRSRVQAGLIGADDLFAAA